MKSIAPPKLYHLAQINIARMLAPLDQPLMADFVNRLDAINALADASPGFVWRLIGPTTDDAFGDPSILVNMSVWETFDALKTYVYKSAHAGVMRDRRRWFAPFEGPYYAMWWLPAGTLPTVKEGKDRIDLLAGRGASADAFWFGAPFAAPDGTGGPRTNHPRGVRKPMNGV